jgi:microcystin-dependent protein
LFFTNGNTYGTGDGTTTYNVPNLQGRIPVGKDSTQTEFDALAETGGSKTSTLITANLPSHQHGVGTILPNTIADHVHAHTLAIANHSSSHTHTVDPPSTAVSVTVNDNTVDRVIRLTSQVASGFTTGVNPATLGSGLQAGTTGFGVSNAYVGMSVDHENEHTHTASGTVDIASFTSGSESGFAAMVHSFTGSITAGGGHTHTMSGSTALEGSGTAFNNLAPYIVVNYIIKL